MLPEEEEKRRKAQILGQPQRRERAGGFSGAASPWVVADLPAGYLALFCHGCGQTTMVEHQRAAALLNQPVTVDTKTAVADGCVVCGDGTIVNLRLE